MNTTNTEMAGSFWKLYDEFVQTDNNFRNESLNKALTHHLYRHPDISKIRHPEKKDASIRGWIALSDRSLNNAQGQRVLNIMCGEVVIEDHGLCSDIIVTHSPCVELASGWLIYGERAKGLFIPIFEPDILKRAIDYRLDEEKSRISAWFEEKCKQWARYDEYLQPAC